jgi:hypothetical protein
MKTANTIKADVRTLLEGSVLKSFITREGGAIYVDTRPTDSKKPDCVVSLISGETGQASTKGLLIVKAFYSDELLNDTWYENMSMGHTLQELLYGFSESLMGNLKYNFSRYGRQVFSEQPKELEASHQRYAILRMNFNINNHLK